MGLPPDEHLPEVVPNQPLPYPEVVPDSSPEAAQQRFYMEGDKYPAYYDNAPKLLHEQEQPEPGMLLPPDQQYPQPWMGAGEMPMTAVSPLSSVPWQSFPPGGGDDQTFVGSEPEPERRICGLRRRLFFIIAAIVSLVVVAAAVGGGVGGSMAAKSKASSSSQADGAGGTNTTSGSSSGASSIAPSSATASTKSSSTSTAPTPTVTNLANQTDPSVFNLVEFQGWVLHNYTGNSTPIYRQLGFYDLPFAVTSYYWLPNATGACITFCENKTYAGGFRCDPYHQPSASGPFSRISIWTGSHENTTLQNQCS